MHILIPVFFNAPLGGLHSNVMSTALYCKNHKHEVTVVCKEGVFANQLRNNHINVITTNFTDEEYKDTVIEILKLHQENPIDIIHTHPFKSRKLSLLLSKLMKVPVVLTIHGRYKDNIDKYINEVEMVYTVSEGIKDFLFTNVKKLEAFKHKFFVVPNGVDTNLFSLQKNDIASASYNKSSLNISLVTRLDKDKEFIIEIFYKALKHTSERFADKVRWTIVGDGTLKSEMQEKVKEITNGNVEVDFTGWKEETELFLEYMTSDIIIAPGRCALEGMSCGKPVIAIGSKGYNGLIDKGNWLNGVYSNFGGIGNKMQDYSEGIIEQELSSLIENDTIRTELGRLGSNLIKQFYCEDSLNQRLLSFYLMLKKENDLENVDLNEIDTTVNRYLLEDNLKNAVITEIAPNKFNLKVFCNDYENITFAWYIYKENQIIAKLPYSKPNSLTYEFKDTGSYRIKYYLKKGDVRIARASKYIQVEEVHSVEA